MDKQTRLLEALNQAQSQYIDEVSPFVLFNNIIEQLLLITDSEYGFIGEVLYKDDVPYLKTYALTNIAWNDETRKFYENNAPTGLEFCNLKTLFGSVLTTKEVVISNSPLTDKRAGGIPEGHPDLNAFLGVPVFAGDEFVGMFGLANKKDGYKEEDVNFLKPLLATSAQLIKGYRINKERLDARNEALRAKEEAEVSNNSKSEFMAKMNHELRTPLNGIMGLINILEDEVLSTDLKNNNEIVEYFNDIKYSSNHLLELIAETLDLSEIEKGDFSLNIESIKLNDLLTEIEKSVLGIMNDNKFSIVNNTKIENFKADKLRIKQVLINLLGNSFKFTDKGEVKLVLDSLDSESGVLIKFSVIDSGIGVDKDFIKEMFSPFTQEDSKNNRKFEGAGLGLTICRRIIDLHRGEISVESVKGSGTTISFFLPIVGS